MRPSAPALTVALLTLLLTTLPLEAGVDRWTAVGPAGGHVTALAPDPSASGVLYAGTRWGGLFKSVDDGRRWTELAGGLPVGGIRALALDPLGPETLYVSVDAPGTHGLYASADGGRSFRPVGPAFLPFLLAVAAGPPGMVYAVGPLDPFQSCAFACLLKSTDGGESWQELLSFPSAFDVRSLALHPERPEESLLGVRQGLYRSTDGGESWTLVEEDLGGQRLGIVLELARAPSQPETVYAAAQERLLRSTDGGRSWRHRGPLPGDCAAEGLAVHPGDPETVYVYCGSGLLRSRDGGRSWEVPAPELPVSYYLELPVDPLVIHPTRPAVLYAGTPEAGIYRSEDGGDRWRPASAGVRQAWVQQLVFHPHDPSILHALTRVGIEGTRDGGGSWRSLGTLPHPGVPPLALAVHPSRPSTLFLGLSGGLYRSTDGGAGWSRVLDGLVRAVVIDPTTPSRIYAGSSGGLFRSLDGGATWSRTLDRWVIELDLDPARPRVLYASSPGSMIRQPTTFRSTDGGSTWQQLTEALFGLQIAPGEPSTLYWNGQRSDDGGETWVPIPFPAAASGEMVVVPRRPAVLYTGGPGGLFRSADGGDTWGLLPLPEQRYRWPELSSAAAHPLAPDRLYSFPGTGGLYALQPVNAEPLLLQDGRFEVRSVFRDPAGRHGPGKPRALTAEAGAFEWRGTTREVVKLLDGRGVNGRFWAFAAGLSTFETAVTILDRPEGTLVDLFQPLGPPVSRADLHSFPPLGEEPAAAQDLLWANGPGGGPVAPASTARDGGDGPCAPGPRTLCLLSGRFRAEIAWRGPGGGLRPGRALPFADDAGAFSFTTASNLEVAMRMADGRAVNGRFWLFVGGLTSLPYALTVTDTATGAVLRYDNPAGKLASQADFAAF